MILKTVNFTTLEIKDISIDELLKDIVLAIGYSGYIELRKKPFKVYKTIYSKDLTLDYINAAKENFTDTLEKQIIKMKKENALIVGSESYNKLCDYLKNNKMLLMDCDDLFIEEFILKRELD